MVLEDLLAVGLFYLLLGGLVAVLGQSENLVVILGLYVSVSTDRIDSLMLSPSPNWVAKDGGFFRVLSATYLPVLGLQLKHHGVLSLALLAIVHILDLLSALLGLDSVILGKGALVAGSAGVSQEMRSNRLDAALDSTRELANGLEVLIGTPTLGQGGKGKSDNLRSGSHCELLR